MSEKREKLLKELYDTINEISVLGSCVSLLDWDERTYMPRKGSEHRGNQIALISGMAHEKFTAPRIGELINEIIADGLNPDDDSIDAANIRELKRSYEKYVKLPKSLVEETSKTVTMAQGIWQEARQKSDFASFKPWLEKVIGLKQQRAEAIGYKGVAYNAMLDDYEAGASTDDITKVFAGLREPLVDLIARIKSSGKSPDTGIITRNYPVDRQEKFGTEAAKIIGYDFEAGRIDITAHPFCTDIGPGDIRITTRYNPNHFPQAFFGILHESGHAIYDQGLIIDHYGTPCSEPVSLGIHESQSRMWENVVGRSRGFWKFWFPQLRKVFPRQLDDQTLNSFYRAINKVSPSLIRVEADEVTYSLHIMLRFELENMLIEGKLKPADVPEAWNAKMKEYLGIVPPNDALGCLQDVHWSYGSIGYFCTYSLGSMFAVQLWEKALKDHPTLPAEIEKGEFGTLLKWLRSNVHTHGRKFTLDELARKVTGEPLQSKSYVAYLKKKFGDIYGV